MPQECGTLESVFTLRPCLDAHQQRDVADSLNASPQTLAIRLHDLGEIETGGNAVGGKL